MKIFISFILITLLMLQTNCNSEKQKMNLSKGTNPVINATIADFTKTDSLINLSDVFALKQQNTLQLATGAVNKEKYKNINGLPYQSILNVSINLGPQNYGEDIKNSIGTKNPKLPTRYIIRDEKLFFWWDTDFEFTEEMYEVLKKFKLIKNIKTNPKEGMSEKTIDYYFCQNDLSKFYKEGFKDQEITKNNAQFLCFDD